MWQIYTAAGILAIMAGTAYTIQKKSRRRALACERAKKCAELSANDFVFSKEYPMGGGTLLVDKKHKQWVFLDAYAPIDAVVYPYDAIVQAQIVCTQKVHGGLRSPIGVSAIRRSATDQNRLESITDSMRGVEIEIASRETPLFINTLDSECSAERVQAIFESLQAQARAGLPLENPIHHE